MNHETLLMYLNIYQTLELFKPLFRIEIKNLVVFNYTNTLQSLDSVSDRISYNNSFITIDVI